MILLKFQNLKEFGFDPVNVVVRTKESWVTISRGTPSLATCVDAKSMSDSKGFDLEY